MNLPIRHLRISIRSRIALAVFVSSAVVLIAMSAAVYLTFERYLQDNFSQDLEDRAASYASLVEVNNGSVSMRLVVDPRRDRAQGEALVRLFGPNGGLIEDGSPAAGTSIDEAALVQQAESSSAEVTRTLSYSDGEDFRVLATPIYDSDRLSAVLITGLETSTVDNPLAVLRVILLLATPASSLGLALISFAIVRRGLRPVATITESANRIAAGDLHERIEGIDAHDEVGELANTFNEMIERLAETVERERRFTADAAHELRTPLAAIETAVDVTLSDLRSSDEYVKALKTVQGQTSRLDRLMRQLLLLSTLDVATFQLRMEVLDLGALVEGVSRSFAEEHPETSLTFQASDSPIACLASEELLTRAFSNVLENAIVHGSLAANIKVDLRRDGESARIVIADDGPGISSELAGTVFHRFRRGDDARTKAGTGLGLSIVESIMRVHHGSVRLLPATRGAAFEFSLPLAEDFKRVSGQTLSETQQAALS